MPGASEHPGEAVCPFSLLFLQMFSSCESILDHIADYLKFISKAQSFLFTLNTSYDQGCHLASCFRLEPNNYEVLLVLARLALYTKRGAVRGRSAMRGRGAGGRKAAA